MYFFIQKITELIKSYYFGGIIETKIRRTVLDIPYCFDTELVCNLILYQHLIHLTVSYHTVPTL